VSAPAPIPFIDLRPGDDEAAVREAIDRVLARGWFVLGPEVEAFESEFAAASGAAYAVGVGTGTDAIALALRALDIGGGDEVIVPAMTAPFTALAVIGAGATPVIVDVEPGTLTIDPSACAAAVTTRTRAIVPVHLYGQAADMAAIRQVAARHSLAVVEDCCQAHLATCGGRPVGSFGACSAFSFYPTKNLGALGDAGAIVTNDPAVAARAARLRNGGQADKYRHLEFGVNSRLDEMQAAVLRARLPFLPSWTSARRQRAAAYREALRDVRTVTVPPERDAGHVYHLFPVRSRARDAMQTHLRAKGIETLIHYPYALPEQPAFASEQPAACPIASQACREIFSLPLHPALPASTIDAVAAALADGPA